MRGARFLTVLLIVFALAPGSRAEEKKWSEEAELSLVDTGGNTQVTTLSAKNLLKYRFTNKLQGAWKLGECMEKAMEKRMQRATSLNSDWTINLRSGTTTMLPRGGCRTSLRVLSLSIT